MTSKAYNDMPAQPLKTMAELGYHTQQESHHSIGEGGRKSSRMKNDLHSRLKDGFGLQVTQKWGTTTNEVNF